ncbi:hypothetical protein B0H11DRAFT_1910426 [Mycena galericulata]|nr:hypothetical protein B0H11DRAFT_1910426 [Mycena galericulata]
MTSPAKSDKDELNTPTDQPTCSPNVSAHKIPGFPRQNMGTDKFEDFFGYIRSIPVGPVNLLDAWKQGRQMADQPFPAPNVDPLVAKSEKPFVAAVDVQAPTPVLLDVVFATEEIED